MPGQTIPIRRCTECGELPRLDQPVVVRNREDGTRTIDHRSCVSKTVPIRIQETHGQPDRRKRP